MRNRLLLGLGVVPLAVLLAGTGWVLTRHDLEGVDDADLRVDLAELDASDNGALLLEEAARLLVWPEERAETLMDALNGDIDALGLVRDVVAPNREALAALERALAAPAFQVPVLDTLEQDAPSLVHWEQLAQILSLRALLVAKQDGLVDLFTALELGRRVETAGGGNLLHAMTGIEIRRNALTAFHTWIEMTPLRRGESHDIARRLEPYTTDAEAWARTWTAEYLALKSTLQERASQGEEPESGGLLPRGFVYHPNRTLEGFAERYRRQASNGGRICSRLSPLAEPGADRAWLPQPNAAGEALLAAATPSLERFQHRRCAADTRVAAIQAMAGIRAYWDEHRDLPETLDELVPDYLDVVPADPFDGESLRWNLDHAWVYSVGDDFLDERGRVSLVVDDLSEPTYRFLFCAGPFGERRRATPAALRPLRSSRASS